MSSPKYIMRYMTTEDIPQVVEVDKLAFPMPWSPRSYLFEVNDNDSAHMVVVEAPADSGVAGGFINTLRRLGGYRTVGRIAGYGGLWYIDGETHISTIASHPDYRGRGLGELLLAGMLMRGISLGAEYAVLEVRVSNQTAINLYKKYEFEIVGERKNYYRDNNENAYLMHVAPLDEAYKQRFNERIKQLRTKLAFVDEFNERIGT